MHTAYKNFGFDIKNYPNAFEMYRNEVTLPLHTLLLNEDIEYICEKYNVPVIVDGDIDTLSKTIGKSNKAVIGIKDVNFAESIQKKYNGGDVIG